MVGRDELPNDDVVRHSCVGGGGSVLHPVADRIQTVRGVGTGQMSGAFVWLSFRRAERGCHCCRAVQVGMEFETGACAPALDSSGGTHRLGYHADGGYVGNR